LVKVSVEGEFDPDSVDGLMDAAAYQAHVEA